VIEGDAERTELTTEEITELPETGKFSSCSSTVGLKHGSGVGLMA